MSAPTPLRPGTPAPVTVRAPGKINVHLGVGGVDEHGYHTLATVFQALGMVETLTLIPGGTGTILVQGRYADETVPVGGVQPRQTRDHPPHHRVRSRA